MLEIILAHAVCNEFGGINNGKPGDQKQTNTEDWSGELRLQKFYMNKKGWMVLRAKASSLADSIARLATEAVNNPNIGYSQNDRDSLYACGSVRTKKKCNADCSSLVRQVVREASQIYIPDFSTADEVEVLSKTGLFQPAFEYIPGKTTLFTGDILVTKVKGHTATVAKGMSTSNPFVQPKVTVCSNAVAKRNEIKTYCPKGDPVAWVQYALSVCGYLTGINNCGGIDGECGSGTTAVIKRYQADNGLEVDGIVGRLTRAKLAIDTIW